MGMFQPGGQRPVNLFAFASLDNKEHENKLTETAFFESLSDDAMYESVEKIANANLRADGASAVVTWVEDGDTDSDALDNLCLGLATNTNGDEVDDMTEDELDLYEEIVNAAAEFMIQVCGADKGQVAAIFSGDDDASATVFDAVESFLNGTDTDELIADFSVRENLMMESTELVVRNGEVVRINKRKNRRKRRMTSAQKHALKLARQKAHTAAAKAARRKARKLRKSRGLK